MSGRVRCIGLTRVVGCVVCALVLIVPQAHAATSTFTTAGEYAFTVPAGIKRVHLVAVGGKGGDAGAGVDAVAGSFGGTATADLAVNPGEVLYVEVGGNGTSPGGFFSGGAGANGGGAGGGHGAGGGGGASDVRTSPSSVALTDSDTRLIVAGGGGGAGIGPADGVSGVGVSGGEGGGIIGAAGAGPSDFCTAGGGSQSAGGFTPEPPYGHPGSLGAGGSADNGGFNNGGGGGGGGGGLYGGGAGPRGYSCSGDGGGGGGSGYFGTGTSNQSFGTDSTGIPSVAITAAEPPSVSLTGPADGATYELHQSVAASYACTAAAAATLSVCSGTVADGAAIDTSTPGRYTFSVTGNDADGGTTTVHATYTVSDPVQPSVSLKGPAGGATYALHQRVTASYTCTGAPGKTITSCSGTVPNGTPIDTSTPGRYAFSVTTTDTDGNSTTSGAIYTVLAPPALTAVRLVKGNRAKARGTFEFTLDRASAVTLAFSRHTTGRKTSLAGKLTARGHAGPNKLKFAGAVGGHKLKPGTYTVAITARDRLGQVSKRRILRFTIVERGAFAA
jgi:hypothetical protein